MSLDTLHANLAGCARPRALMRKPGGSVGGHTCTASEVSRKHYQAANLRACDGLPCKGFFGQ